MRLGRTVPSLPVRDVAAAVEHWTSRLGFAPVHVEPGAALLRRDDAEVHLWHAGDAGWRSRPDLADGPVWSGAESFLAGTASCRVEVDDVDALHAELFATGTLHPGDPGRPQATGWGTREAHALDADGNLVTFFARG